jgi:hypothetical protein
MMTASERTAGGRRGRGWADFAEAFTWLAVVVGLLGLGWNMLCTVPGVPWNAARLAPSFALARGLPIYALRESGAHLGWFYGPVFPLWYLPFAWLENPTVAFMLAAGWNIVTVLLPVFLVVRAALGGRTGAAARATVVGVVLMLANPMTQGAFYMLHIDAVCVAGVLAACVALHAGAVRGWRPGLPLAALAVALAVGTKQLAVMVVPATLVWLWREGYGRLIRDWLFWLVACGGGLAVIFLAVFGTEELLFNAWFVLARTPWRGGWALLAQSGWDLVQTAWVWWVACGIGWLVLRPAWRGPLAPEAGAMVRLLGWAAAWQAPFGLVASLKAGGGINSVHAVFYGLVAGLIVVGAALVQADATRADTRRLRPALVLGAALLVGLAVDYRVAFLRDSVWTPYRGLENLLARARASPGSLYLPWNPLITIISDRKIYPFDDALLSLWRAKLEPPREAIRAAIPAGAVIFYQEPSQSHFALNYFGPEARAAAEPKREP